MNRLNQFLIPALLGIFFSAGTASAQDFNAISASILSSSSCSRADIELVVQASGIEQEGYRVTSSGEEFDFSSVLPAAQSSITGAINRSIAFPKAASGGSLIGVSYTLAGARYDDKYAAHYFAVYSCAQVSPIYSCAGTRDSCPETVADYLPHLGRAHYSARGTFGVIGDRSAHTKYFYYCNNGQVGTTISSVAIEGKDAGAFSLTYSDLMPLQLGAGNCGSATVVFRSRKLGEFSATLRIHPANPDVSDLVIPLSATTRRLPDLSLDVQNLRVGDQNGAKAILGDLIVKNNGLGASQAGAVVSVKVSAYLSEDKSAPVTLLKVKLPALKPGQKHTLRFASRKHNFSEKIVKVVTADVSGTTRQRGLKNSESTFSDYEYFES